LPQPCGQLWAGPPSDRASAEKGPSHAHGPLLTKNEDVPMAKQLQLTFDDGPEPVASALTPILAEVARRKIVAAFFNLSTIAAQGHVLGNHSWDHLMPHTKG
jgi:peptidoglycan/xylan/chitin deacetylase (PgdA/CDA1 family)